MDYKRFSKSAFESLSGDAMATSRLLQELDEAITNEVKSTVLAAMQKVVDKLNENGHRLSFDPDIDEPGETQFSEHHDSPNSGFRVGSDIVISSGYCGVHDCTEFDETGA